MEMESFLEKLKEKELELSDKVVNMNSGNKYFVEFESLINLYVEENLSEEDDSNEYVKEHLGMLKEMFRDSFGVSDEARDDLQGELLKVGNAISVIEEELSGIIDDGFMDGSEVDEAVESDTEEQEA